MRESVESLRQLRRRIAAIEGKGPVEGPDRAAIGHPGMDAALGGGVARGRLHELFAADPADAASTAGFAAMMACRLGGAIVWLREQAAERQAGTLHPPGLVEIGFDPARLILGVMPDPKALLRAAGEVARCPEVGVAIVELWRDPSCLDLTASRRLALAVEESGVTALMLRVAAEPLPSAANSRWRIASAPAPALAADAPGPPALEVELLRQRGRAETGRWRVEWDRDERAFRDLSIGEAEAAATGAPLPGTVLPFPGGGQAGADPAVPFRRAG